jgi:Transposase IS66 family/Helix-turn-helix domain
VTQITLYGGVCLGCARRFKAQAPAGLEPGSPFGPNLRAFVIYLRSVQGTPLARLSDVLRDLLGLDISEGALVNILAASAKPFKAQTNLIKARLLSGTALASDETGLRVCKPNWWLWVFHHRDSAVFVADKHRSKGVEETFLGDWRPDYWISDRYGGQMGWAKREQQVCLAHLIRDVQYAIDEGDELFAPGLKGLLKRACAIGRRRPELSDATLKASETSPGESLTHWGYPELTNFDSIGRIELRRGWMGAPLEIVRTDHMSAEFRVLSNRCADGAQVRRILALAMVFDGRSRTEAAEMNGMDRQTLRDWVHRYNACGIGGLKARRKPGRAPLMTT